MNPDILMPILTISGIAIGLGIFLNEFVKRDDDKFDERQLIEQGRGANLSMNTAFSYFLGLYAGYAFDLIRPEYMTIFAVYGLAVTMMVYHGYCIFHDAFLNREQELGPRVLECVLAGGAWLALALLRMRHNDQDAWINGALALSYLPQAVMLLLRELMLRIRDRSSAKEEDDG